MKHYIMLLLAVVLMLCGCSHRTYQSAEKTFSVSRDTFVLTRTDSVIVHDTITTISQIETTDSIVESVQTIVVVDSAGKVLSKVVYRDRGVYHNKDALSSSHHVTNRTQKKNESLRSVANKQESVKSEIKIASRRKALVTIISFAFLIALIVTIYRYIYSKGK